MTIISLFLLLLFKFFLITLPGTTGVFDFVRYIKRREQQNLNIKKRLTKTELTSVVAFFSCCIR